MSFISSNSQSKILNNLADLAVGVGVEMLHSKSWLGIQNWSSVCGHLNMSDLSSFANNLLTVLFAH